MRTGRQGDGETGRGRQGDGDRDRKEDREGRTATKRETGLEYSVLQYVCTYVYLLYYV